MTVSNNLAEFGIDHYTASLEPIDVLGLTRDELAERGVRLPEALFEEQHRDILERSFAGGLVLLPPQLRHSLKRHGPVQVAQAAGTSFNWAGVWVSPPAGTTFGVVAGHWQVPAVGAPGGVAGSYWSSSWVGIDGVNSPDVFQAGVDHDISARPDGTTYVICGAWFEWFPDFAVDITNLNVQVGDSVLVSLVSTSPTAGNLLFTCANQGVSLTFSAPAGTTLKGDSAEWVVERPAIGITASLGNLPSFTPVSFTGLTPSISMASANTLQMQQNAAIVASVAHVDPQAVLVEHQSPSPACANLDRQIASRERAIAGLQAQLRSVPPPEKPDIVEQIAEESDVLTALEQQKARAGCP